MCGYLEVTFGPMFSGKTTALIDKVNRFISVRKIQSKSAKVLIINYVEDTRATETEDGLTPHIERKIMDCDKTVMKVNNLTDVDVEPYDYIVVDECQFFDDLVVNVMTWLTKKKHIHCSGLLADSERRIFGDLYELIPRADHVEQLKAFCTICGDKILNAPFTKCMTYKTDQTLIGGSGDYIPVCGKHF